MTVLDRVKLQRNWCISFCITVTRTITEKENVPKTNRSRVTYHLLLWLQVTYSNEYACNLFSCSVIRMCDQQKKELFKIRNLFHNFIEILTYMFKKSFYLLYNHISAKLYIYAFGLINLHLPPTRYL